MPIVIRGQGKAKLSDFAARTIRATNNAPAPKGAQLGVAKAAPPARLTQAEKADLVKSVQPTLLKINPKFKTTKLDPNSQPWTLTPRTPWVDGKGNVEFMAGNNSGASSVYCDTTDDPPQIYFETPGSIAADVRTQVNLFFYPKQAGMYLITFHCYLSPTTMEVVTDSGTTEGPTSSTFANGPAIVPIVFIVSDVNNWQLVGITPSPNTVWEFYSVDIQYLSAMPGQ